MNPTIALPIIAIMMLSGVDASFASDLKDQVKVEIASAGLHPGMYVCGEGHLHIKGTVQNLADVPVGSIKVAGKVYDRQVAATRAAISDDAAFDRAWQRPSNAAKAGNRIPARGPRDTSVRQMI